MPPRTLRSLRETVTDAFVSTYIVPIVLLTFFAVHVGQVPSRRIIALLSPKYVSSFLAHPKLPLI